MVIIDDCTDARLKRQVRLFNPASWGSVHGAKRKKLLQQWDIAVKYALLAYCQNNGNSVAYRIGWTFSEETEAAHSLLDESTHALLLNPVQGQDSPGLGIGN